MKPKLIKEGEPFTLHNTTYVYKVEGEKIVITKVLSATLETADAKKTSIKANKNQSKTTSFIPPTITQVKDFFKEKGYSEETAIRAWNHYENGEPKWTDTNGKPVRSWKQKMLTNWCKPENKIADEKTNSMKGMIMSLIFILLFSCTPVKKPEKGMKKSDLIDAIEAGSKLTKADAGLHLD